MPFSRYQGARPQTLLLSNKPSCKEPFPRGSLFRQICSLQQHWTLCFLLFLFFSSSVCSTRSRNPVFLWAGNLSHDRLFLWSRRRADSSGQSIRESLKERVPPLWVWGFTFNTQWSSYGHGKSGKVMELFWWLFIGLGKKLPKVLEKSGFKKNCLNELICF